MRGTTYIFGGGRGRNILLEPENGREEDFFKKHSPMFDLNLLITAFFFFSKIQTLKRLFKNSLFHSFFLTQKVCCGKMRKYKLPLHSFYFSRPFEADTVGINFPIK